MSLAAVVWHYWLAVPMAAMAVVGLLATIVGYFIRIAQAIPRSRVFAPLASCR